MRICDEYYSSQILILIQILTSLNNSHTSTYNNRVRALPFIDVDLSSASGKLSSPMNESKLNPIFKGNVG